MSAVFLPRLLRVGPGALNEVPVALAQLGLARPVLITDRFLAGNGTLERLTQVLQAARIEARVFADAVPDPTAASVEAATEFLHKGSHDCVIGLGGGSAIDTAKAVGVLARLGGDVRALKAPHQQDTPGLPIIAIPTTAGTGSEATRFAVISDELSNEKMLCAGLAYLPMVAIVDYELTLSKPQRLTADTGIDSLTHAIESYVSRRANPFSDSMAIAALKAIWSNIREACTTPDNRRAREGMMIGALQAGIAFSNSSVALVHAMSRPIGAHFHVSHGLSNAMLLPVVTEWSAPAALPRYADCARVMGVATASDDDTAAAARLVEALRQLNADLKVPTPQSFGIDEQRWSALLPLMAEQALSSGSPANNPRIPDAGTIQTLYRLAWA